MCAVATTLAHDTHKPHEHEKTPLSPKPTEHKPGKTEHKVPKVEKKVQVDHKPIPKVDHTETNLQSRAP